MLLFISILSNSEGCIAQLVEHPAFNRIVVGSSPTIPIVSYRVDG